MLDLNYRVYESKLRPGPEKRKENLSGVKNCVSWLLLVTFRPRPGAAFFLILTKDSGLLDI